MEGVSYDIWTYGLMALNMLTINWPSLRMGPVEDPGSWKSNVERVIKEALEVWRQYISISLETAYRCLYPQVFILGYHFKFQRLV